MAQPKQAIAGVAQSVAVTVDANNNPVATPRLLPMAITDTVQWTNNTGYTIDILFHGASKGVFNDVQGLANGATSTVQLPQQDDVIANYIVKVYAGVTSYQSGPNAIEVGTGPLIVDLTYDSTTSSWRSDPAAGIIPLQQTVMFANLDPTNSCPVAISPAGIFVPSSFTISPNSHHSTTAQPGQSGTATYTLGTNLDAKVTGDAAMTIMTGVGTVKVGSGGGDDQR